MATPPKHKSTNPDAITLNEWFKVCSDFQAEKNKDPSLSQMKFLKSERSGPKFDKFKRSAFSRKYALFLKGELKQSELTRHVKQKRDSTEVSIDKQNNMVDDASKFKLVGHMSKEPRLTGKICFISGAARGFGQAIAIRFVEEGAKVVLFDLVSCEETLNLIKTIEGLGENNVSNVAFSIHCDISQEASIEAMVKAASEKFPTASDYVLINNAARFVFKSIEDATGDDWDQSYAVNIKGHALVTKHILPLMKQSGGGSIIFMGSISSFLGQPHCATYATMKGALVQMTRSCAYDFAKYRIRVNAICAGTIETPISQQERLNQGWTYEEWEKLKTKDVMMKRVGHAREIANATLFYASNESSYCTGGHLMVDGGQTACTVMMTE